MNMTIGFQKQEVRLTFGSLRVEGIDNMIPVILFSSGRCSTIGKASEIDPLFIFPWTYSGIISYKSADVKS